MPQKLAIAISGAVSLGSFEAGVIYEIIEAIAQHNQHPDTTDDQKIIIDVITGASAGAMTAAILAQRLLFEADKLRVPYQNDLYRAWIEDADIRTLLQPTDGDNPDMAILSSGFVQTVGNKYLLNRYNSASPSTQRHPAVADKLHLGIALANLNGFDFTQPLTNIQGQLNSEEDKNSFTFTRHQDCYITQIQGNQNDDKRELWDLIRKIGIASGSFPFAFKVQEVTRLTVDPVYQNSDIYGTGVNNLVKFAYTDGGVFENEPLGMAIGLTKQLDKSPQDYENRFFLYAAPGPKSSRVNKTFTAAQATYLNTARALAGALFTQARFQDWIGVSETNQLVLEFDNQAWLLKDFLKSNPDQYSDFDQLAEKLLQAVYAADPSSPNQQAADNQRLREAFAAEYQELASLEENGDAIAASWLKVVQALEKAANLGSRELLVVYAITAKDDELAGEQLSAFGGFFDQSFRDYDYYVGRTKAIAFLEDLKQKKLQGVEGRQLSLLNFQPGKDLQKPGADLGDVTLEKIDRKLRKQVKDLLLDRLGRLIDSVEKRFWINIPLKFFAKIMAADELNKLLGLR